MPPLAPSGTDLPAVGRIVDEGRRLAGLIDAGRWRVGGRGIGDVLDGLIGRAGLSEAAGSLRGCVARPDAADWWRWAGEHVGTFEGRPDDHRWHEPTAEPYGQRQAVTFADKVGVNLTADGLTLGYVPKDSTNGHGLMGGLHVGFPADLPGGRQAILWVLPAEAFLEVVGDEGGRRVRTAHGVWDGGEGGGRWVVRPIPRSATPAGSDNRRGRSAR